MSARRPAISHTHAAGPPVTPVATLSHALSSGPCAHLHWRAGASENLASPRPSADQPSGTATRRAPAAPTARTYKTILQNRACVLYVGIGLAGRGAAQTWNVTARCARAGRDRGGESGAAPAAPGCSRGNGRPSHISSVLQQGTGRVNPAHRT